MPRAAIQPSRVAAPSTRRRFSLYIGDTNAYKPDTRTKDGGDLSFSKMHPISVRYRASKQRPSRLREVKRGFSTQVNDIGANLFLP